MYFTASLMILSLIIFDITSRLVFLVSFPLALAVRRFFWGEAYALSLGNILNVAAVATLVAQLVNDYASREPTWRFAYIAFAGLLLQVLFLEMAIQKRKLLMDDARGYTRFPQYDPRVRLWWLLFVPFLPLFLIFLYYPNTNVPYVYHWYSSAVDFVFGLRFVGPIVLWLACLLGLRVAGGSLIFLVLRIAEALGRVPEEDRAP